LEVLMKEFRVIKSRRSEFDNPIKVIEDQTVLCLEESDPLGDWPDWVLCETKDNKGWIPKSIIRRKADLGIITEDYDATEFDLTEDEIVVMDYAKGGWIWGHKSSNPEIKGWTPLTHLEAL